MLESMVQAVALEKPRITILPDGRMTRDDAAKYLGLKSKTLAAWHLQKKGPAIVLVGGRRYYFRSELDRFISQGTSSS